MIFKFAATCRDQHLPLEVKMEFRPGKQSQRARRIAAGHLIALLECETATIDASGDGEVRVHVGEDTWVIA